MLWEQRGDYDAGLIRSRAYLASAPVTVLDDRWLPGGSPSSFPVLPSLPHPRFSVYTVGLDVPTDTYKVAYEDREQRNAVVQLVLAVEHDQRALDRAGGSMTTGARLRQGLAHRIGTRRMVSGMANAFVGALGCGPAGVEQHLLKTDVPRIAYDTNPAETARMRKDHSRRVQTSSRSRLGAILSLMCDLRSPDYASQTQPFPTTPFWEESRISSGPVWALVTNDRLWWHWPVWALWVFILKALKNGQLDLYSMYHQRVPGNRRPSHPQPNHSNSAMAEQPRTRTSQTGRGQPYSHLRDCMSCCSAVVTCVVDLGGPSVPREDYLAHPESCHRCLETIARCKKEVIPNSRAPSLREMSFYADHLRACKPCRRFADACGVVISNRLSPYTKHVELCLPCRLSIKSCNHPLPKVSGNQSTTIRPAAGPEYRFRLPILLLLTFFLWIMGSTYLASVILAIALFV
ncbi:hypothetical protein DFP72DRAFT_853282 [Ephemerocybe angulata]|uniref:Uncharacterized protein n=1 Tax=Ephemerocybe angulata TaxID=980116 RepID=A0A8H6HMX2_9AGAR|nr:hypothetical protein DFP72DRAFT_853282 [Tulosesus angulatus]